MEISKSDLIKDIVAQMRPLLQEQQEQQDVMITAKIEALKEELKSKLSQQQPEQALPVTTNWEPDVPQETKRPLTLWDKALYMSNDEIKSTFKGLADEVQQFRRFNDDLLLVAAMTRKPVQELKMYRKFVEGQSPLAKALSSTGVGAGDEWVPTLVSDQFYDVYRLRRRVAALFPEIQMPSNPFNLPIATADATAYVGGENTAVTASQPTTSAAQLNALRISAYIPFSDELLEDAAIALLPVVREALANALGAAIETAIINGDTSTTHMDSDVTSSVDVRKNYVGLRKIASDAGTYGTSLATFSTSNLRTVRAALGKYGVAPGELAWITSINGYVKLLGLAEVLTADKYAQSATLLNGELARFDGSPVIVSEYVRQNLNASGVYDGITTTKTIVGVVNHRQFIVGVRKDLTIESWYDPKAGQHQVVARQRIAFTPLRGSSEGAVAWGINA